MIISKILRALSWPGLGGGGMPAPAPPPAAPPPPATPIDAKTARQMRRRYSKTQAANVRNKGGGAGMDTADTTTTGKFLLGQ